MCSRCYDATELASFINSKPAVLLAFLDGRGGAAHVCQELEVYEAAYRQRVVKGLARRAAALGYRLEPTSATGT